MITRSLSAPIAPDRTVVVGGFGFVGGAITAALRRRGWAVETIGKTDIDLLSEGADRRLAARLRDGDAVVVVSFPAPARDATTMMKALRMTETVVAALDRVPPSHVVAVSSDAVYADRLALIDEQSPCQPSTFHGMTHAARELMLTTALRMPLAVLRPSLLYGAADPHNGYGPNRFWRNVRAGEPIRLFGGGEEKRDHVFIEDVGTLVARVLADRARGVLNLVSGESHDFAEVARAVVARATKPVAIETSPRANPIAHRHFDRTSMIRAFPDFRPTPLAEGLTLMIAEGR
ncbi:MAG: SDR family oxidoreductase [Rhodospirillales bacterium]|nr:SDR family oxidoreductase [Rhodospirillales bacterium]